jgi:putative radical SAM enzyme (TIGR03279 family)
MISQRISPIGISVHATEPELRAFMLGNPKGADGFGIMKRFAQAGIMMKCQVVVCPGINDGEHLEKTLNDLCGLFPQVESVSVVPVGLTKHRQGLYPLSPVGREEALRIAAIADKAGEDCLKKYGYRVVYSSDELYLKAGLAIPDPDYYEDYPQYENGVGMLALFKDEFYRALEAITPPQQGTEMSVATGMAAKPFISGLVEELKSRFSVRCNVYGIKNNFLGESVDVAGLISGGDIISQLEGKELGKRLIIPETMLRHGGDMFLDDVTPEQVEEKLKVSLRAVPVDGSAFLNELLND